MAMDTETIFAITVAMATALVGFLAGWVSRRARLAEKADDLEAVSRRLREPLLQAAFNLQSRLFNIVRQNLLCRMRTDLCSVEDQEYVIEYTLYLIGQYLCWVEILRRETLFLDPRERSRNRQVADQLETVRDAFAESESTVGPFRIFRGEQRAIGERMIVHLPGDASHVTRMDCLGYAAFMQEREQPETVRWFRRLRAELIDARDGQRPDFGRLALVQRALVELMHMLDPDARRVPAGMLETL